jgi:hypothetical protein
MSLISLGAGIAFRPSLPFPMRNLGTPLPPVNLHLFSIPAQPLLCLSHAQYDALVRLAKRGLIDTPD